MSTVALTRRDRELDRYIAEVSRYPLLDRDEEQRLARQYRDEHDLTAAHTLVVSNLRFVVKVAHEYKGYGLKLLDLVQEGNIGLMHAVKKFDPDKGYRLISYAVWWIRAEIQAFILKSWSLVKVGSGRVRRKLFFKLRSAKSKLEQELEGDENTNPSDELARRLGVERGEIDEMETRMAARDYSLDAPLTDDAGTTHVDVLTGGEVIDPEQLAASRQEHALLEAALEKTSDSMDDREKVILDRRLLNDEPMTLAEIGSELGVTRERVRQIEKKVVDKLRGAINAADPLGT